MKNERIVHLSESPCYQCGMMSSCIAKVQRCKSLQDIIDYVMPRKNFDFHDCSLYKVLVLEKEHGKKEKHNR